MSFIKYFESTDAGAPTLNNAAGSMIAVLDACLVTGYNTKSVTSITVASGVATVVCTAHGFSNGYAKIIRIEGATPVELNADFRIDNVTTNGFTFLCPGVADGVATGTITAKYAPLGWVKQYSDTNKAMYKRSEVTASSCMLRVADTAVSVTARAIMVRSATDINTYSDQAPTSAQIVDGLGQYWSKGYGLSGAAAPWFVVGDGFYFYLFVKSGPATTASMAHGFGDIVDFKPASVYGCILAGLAASVGNAYAFKGSYAINGCHVVSGAKDGISNSTNLAIESRVSAFGTTGASYPSDVDGGLVISAPILLKEGTTAEVHIRGVQPGFAIPLANIASALAEKTKISNVIGVEKTYLVAHCATGGNEAASSIGLIDLTGPWR